MDPAGPVDNRLHAGLGVRSKTKGSGTVLSQDKGVMSQDKGVRHRFVTVASVSLAPPQRTPFFDNLGAVNVLAVKSAPPL
jgi:hypothetical protein